VRVPALLGPGQKLVGVAGGRVHMPARDPLS
jgi:hypothetical protein